MEKSPKAEATVFHNVISEAAHHHFCHTLLEINTRVRTPEDAVTGGWLPHDERASWSFVSRWSREMDGAECAPRGFILGPPPPSILRLLLIPLVFPPDPLHLARRSS